MQEHLQRKINMDSKKALVVFDGTKIRRIWHDDHWYFSVVDIVAVLTDSANPNNYWKVLKHREPQLVTICNQLKLPSADGKYYNTDCVNTRNAFRLIQSIPSPKAEPFKLWLAKVGYERVQEIDNPELAQERMKQLYEQKGHSQEWIEKRMMPLKHHDRNSRQLEAGFALAGGQREVDGGGCGEDAGGVVASGRIGTES